MTMWEFLSKVLSSPRTVGFIVILIIATVLPSAYFAHSHAAPGTEVNFLNLISYTKANPADPSTGPQSPWEPPHQNGAQPSPAPPPNARAEPPNATDTAQHTAPGNCDTTQCTDRIATLTLQHDELKNKYDTLSSHYAQLKTEHDELTKRYRSAVPPAYTHNFTKEKFATVEDCMKGFRSAFTKVAPGKEISASTDVMDIRIDDLTVVVDCEHPRWVLLLIAGGILSKRNELYDFISGALP